MDDGGNSCVGGDTTTLNIQSFDTYSEIWQHPCYLYPLVLGCHHSHWLLENGLMKLRKTINLKSLWINKIQRKTWK